MRDWIDPALAVGFAAEKTDAYRLATSADGLVERFGADALISYKTEAAHERLSGELAEWEGLTQQSFDRVFGRFLPKQNAERLAPQLLRGDASLPLKRTVLERGICSALEMATAGSGLARWANRFSSCNV